MVRGGRRRPAIDEVIERIAKRVEVTSRSAILRGAREAGKGRGDVRIRERARHLLEKVVAGEGVVGGEQHCDVTRRLFQQHSGTRFRSPDRIVKDPSAEGARDRDRIVGRSSIRDEQLDQLARIALTPNRIEQRRQARRFVQRREDQRKSDRGVTGRHTATFAPSNSAERNAASITRTTSAPKGPSERVADWFLIAAAKSATSFPSASRLSTSGT